MASNIKYNFSAVTKIEDLEWLNEPKKTKLGANGENGLEIYMDKETDFWQKTYYNPPLTNDNGHGLYKDIGSDMLVETKFLLTAAGQFDQAGLLVRKDTECWIKTGLEFVDGKFRLSVVVTNGFSDWSTQCYPSGDLAIRLYRFGSDFVIEAKSPDSDEWNFIRICHLNIGKDEKVKAGLFANAPMKDGGKAVFDYLTYKQCSEYHHKAQ